MPAVHMHLTGKGSTVQTAASGKGSHLSRMHIMPGMLRGSTKHAGGNSMLASGGHTHHRGQEALCRLGHRVPGSRKKHEDGQHDMVRCCRHQVQAGGIGREKAYAPTDSEHIWHCMILNTCAGPGRTWCYPGRRSCRQQ